YTTVDGTTNRIHIVALADGDETIAAVSSTMSRITGDVRWSPDSSRLAYFTVTNSYLTQAHVVDLATSDIVSLGRVHDPTLSWSHDGRRVAYIPVDTYDSIGIATFGAQNTVQKRVHKAPGMLAVNNVRSGNRISFSPDGAQVMYPGRDIREGVTSVNTVDVASGEHTTVSEFNDVEMRFEDAAWLDEGILLVEDQLQGRDRDSIVFHQINPETGERDEIGTLTTGDFLRVVD
ncbi:MAG: hypothetical protein AAF653_15360, partial [Chloroflexota bacterium]